MEQQNKALRSNIRQYGMIIALVVLVVFFYFVTGGRFGRPMNVYNIVMQNSYVLILAIGMLLPILTGNIDLSVSSTYKWATGFEVLIGALYLADDTERLDEIIGRSRKVIEGDKPLSPQS